MKKGLWTAVFLAVGVTGAMAQFQYYLRGEFNGWGLDNPMTDMGGGHYQATRSGLTPGSLYNFKVANEDWSQNAPGSDCRTAADAAGNLTVHMYNNFPFADGWNPDGWWRIGYDDPMQFAWEIMGSFNGWSAPVLSLADMGSGRHAGLLNPGAGTYQWKFRKAGDWGVSIGDNFGNSAGDNEVTVAAGEQVYFELDLPNGRWRTTIVPEPGTLGVLALGAVALLRRKR